MTDDELNTFIRRLTLTRNPAILSDAMLTSAKTEAITILGEMLQAASPETWQKKVSITADYDNTPIFTIPSDNRGIKAVWDYDGAAGIITGAADNGAGLIRITHNLTIEDEERVVIHDVAGCTEANGTWQITYVDSTNLDLVGSTFASAYTSGGRCFREHPDTYNYPIERTPSEYQTKDSETHYYYQAGKIVIDDADFENDIVVLYRYAPTTLTEIPSYLHSGIYAFAVILLAKIPDRGSAMLAVVEKNIKICQGLWDAALRAARTYSPIMQPSGISSVSSIKKWL